MTELLSLWFPLQAIGIALLWVWIAVEDYV